MKKPPLVEVIWNDAYLRSSPATLADAMKDDDHTVRHTVGWLVGETEKKLVVAMTYDPGSPGEEPEFDDRYCLPRQYVKAIRYIERGPKKAKATTPLAAE